MYKNIIYNVGGMAREMEMMLLDLRTLGGLPKAGWDATEVRLWTETGTQLVSGNSPLRGSVGNGE